MASSSFERLAGESQFYDLDRLRRVMESSHEMAYQYKMRQAILGVMELNPEAVPKALKKEWQKVHDSFGTKTMGKKGVGDSLDRVIALARLQQAVAEDI